MQSREDHARDITTPYNALMHIYLQELARLETKAKCLLPEFKREIDTILFWKERQHLVVEKMKVIHMRLRIHAQICNASRRYVTYKQYLAHAYTDAFPCNALQDIRASSEIAVLKVEEDKRELAIMRKANVAIQEFTAADKNLAALRKAKDSRECELHALKEKQQDTRKQVH